VKMKKQAAAAMIATLGVVTFESNAEPIPKCYGVWTSGKQVELRRDGLLPLQGSLEPPSGRN
jgi:hypothetical protein